MTITKGSPNFPPDVFGPSLWFVIHITALRLPEFPTSADKKHFVSFYESLQHVLPCDGCRIGYKKMLESTKFGTKDVKNRDTLFAWTVKIHNMVNARLGKNVNNSATFWKRKYMELSN